jgi:(p)ppGpp synthase/HD superfamily hydrolase
MSTGSITLEQAIAFAAAAHAGQVDKAGQPYVFHVLRVMLRVEGYERQLAALGHDLLEDTHITQNDLLEAGFPRLVVDAIVTLTKLPGEGRIEAARRARELPIGRDVKLADNADNSDLSRIPNPSEKDIARMREYALVREILAG